MPQQRKKQKAKTKKRKVEEGGITARAKAKVPVKGTKKPVAPGTSIAAVKEAMKQNPLGALAKKKKKRKKKKNL